MYNFTEEFKPGWFDKMSVIDRIIITGTMNVGDNAFNGAESVERVDMTGVQIVGENSFKSTISLYTIGLPNGLIEIKANAFENCTSITEVVCPDGLQLISGTAFAGCTQLAAITIPASVSEIGANAFGDSAYPLLIRTSAGSAAMQYAIDNDLDYQADTTYRALLIGQCNYQSAAVLNGTLNDVQSMKNVLSDYAGTSYAISACTDLTAAQITQNISDAFAQAQPQDVSLVFYAGHGVQGGSLYGIDGNTVTPAALRECMDEIPGRKILIVDACYSGALIGRSDSEADMQEFTSAFLSVFATTARGTTLAADEYYV